MAYCSLCQENVCGKLGLQCHSPLTERRVRRFTHSATRTTRLSASSLLSFQPLRHYTLSLLDPHTRTGATRAPKSIPCRLLTSSLPDSSGAKFMRKFLNQLFSLNTAIANRFSHAYKSILERGAANVAFCNSSKTDWIV